MSKKTALFILGLICTVVFLTRHTIGAFLFELAVGKVTYETRDWEDGKLIYKNLRLNEDFWVEKAQIGVDLHFSPFYVEPQILLTTPHLVLREGQVSTSYVPLLLPRKWVRCKLEVIEGIMEIKDKAFSWSFRDNASVTLRDKEGEFLSCKGQKQEGIWSLQCTFAERPFSFFSDLVAIFFPHSWDPLEGDVAIDANITLSDDLSFSSAVDGSVMWRRT